MKIVAVISTMLLIIGGTVLLTLALAEPDERKPAHTPAEIKEATDEAELYCSFFADSLYSEEYVTCVKQRVKLNLSK